MLSKSAIVLVIDRLHAGMLGPYGNTWIETPSFNHLAAESFLFDQAIIDSPDLSAIYRSYWTGQHALAQAVGANTEALPQLLRATGVKSILFSDELAVVDHSQAALFDEIVRVERPCDAVTAESLEESHLARFFTAVSQWLQGEADQTSQRPFLLWLHTRGLAAPWDAPLDLRRRYADEEDPDPPEFTEPPDRMLPDDFDPDELLGIVHAYAGQVTLLDVCLGALLEDLEESTIGKRCLLTVLSARGFPLGEHRRLGACDQALYSELVHVPWFVRLPDSAGASARSHELVQPADLYATLREWFLGQAAPTSDLGLLPGRSLLGIIEGQPFVGRDRACVIGPAGQRGIRTAAWYMRSSVNPRLTTASDGDQRAELFAKPDDRYEVNEVSDRCGTVASKLLEAHTTTEQALQSSASLALLPLDDELIHGLD